ncbi:peptidylprolyl isomerase, partial [candidate division KSB1 bacterium]|nr:peptidylprolyl isomerase [candidate division KSB1 bacterium]
QYTRFGGQEKFEEMIGQQGFDLDFVKNDIKTGLGIQKAIQKAVDDSLEIDDEQMQKEYEDYTSKEIASVRHILMQTTGKNDSEKAEIRKKMEGLLDRAKAGEDFAALAEEFTEDPGSKATGGLYEEFGKGQMVKPFEDAAFTVPVGEISDIVETRYGYHIIKVINRNSYKSFDEKREELLEKMRNQQAPKIQRDYIERLKTEADINIAEIA